MDFRRKKGREEPEINLIPFIDVLLVILIFLMVTTTYSKYTELQISLPKAQAVPMADRVKELRVLVDSEGEYAINNRRIAYENPLQLARELRIVAPADPRGKDPILVIAADGHAPHQRVVNVMEAARLAGMERLTFATQSDVHR
ncbi:MAG: biopolymer transporter ExbD [Burkholderiaceae bacterium]|jgi:biopolymer transport protein ExbD|nr:biopolymer transporter ExbD [Burkholderiaceae bacterium]